MKPWDLSNETSRMRPLGWDLSVEYQVFQKNLLDNSLKGKIKKKEIPKWELVVDGLVFYEWEEDLFGRTSNAVIFSESLVRIMEKTIEASGEKLVL